jgi:hypothetical protein
MAVLMMYLDIDTQQKIKNYYKDLKENGIYSHCLAFDIEPHITVGGFDGIEDGVELDKANETLKMCCSKIKRFKIRFGSIGIFNLYNPTVFLAPDTNKTLLEAHEYLHKTFHDCSVDRDYYCPDRWIPHCTVNEYPDDTVPFDVRLDVICKSTEYLMKTFKPFDAFITSIGFTDYYPERLDLIV